MNPEMHEPEQESLDRLAEELRGAHPHPALSQNFHEVLQARMQNSWSFRAALRRNGLMRVAAGLLMISLVAAPVAAVVQLLKPPEKAPPTLGFELPEGVTEVASSEDAAARCSGRRLLLGRSGRDRGGHRVRDAGREEGPGRSRSRCGGGVGHHPSPAGVARWYCLRTTPMTRN